MNIRTKGSSTRVATSVALVALLMAGNCGPLQAEDAPKKDWFKPPSMPEEPSTTAQSLSVSDPTVVGNIGKEWTIKQGEGKATYKSGDCEIELRWSQPPHWLHPGWKFPMAIGGKIVPGDRKAEKAEGHEQENDFHLKLPPENGGKPVTLEISLLYGPTIVYTYKP